MRTDMLRHAKWVVPLVIGLNTSACDDDENGGRGEDDAGASLDGGVPAADGGQQSGEDAALDGGTSLTDGGADAGGPVSTACDPQASGISLPPGFCATVYADAVGAARHMTVTPAGDVFVALGKGLDGKGGVLALRDSNGDGVAEMTRKFGENGANGIYWHEDKLYFAENDRIVRYDLPSGTLEPAAEPVVVVSGLPDQGDHAAKTIVIRDQQLFVNIGSATNSCQEENRTLESPGIDPCPELEERAGVWVFDATALGQTAAQGMRFVAGGRNLNALALQPGTGQLFGVQNGRDQLFENWPDIYTAEEDARLPAEALYALDQGDDFGWPYCYYDPTLTRHVLAPEYGGNGMNAGRCATIEDPAAVYPAHWAPLGAVFYEGVQFPARYRGGLFIANHGSRFAPNATGDLPGYNVIYQPFADGAAAGAFEEFATEFAGDARPLPAEAAHRPVGVAQSPDGALYISDDKGGRIYRVIYVGVEGEGDAGVPSGDAGLDGGASDAGGTTDAGG